MERTIINHDIETGVARIRFEHNGIKVENDFRLIDVVPGTRLVFESMGLAFDEEAQGRVIDRLTSMIQQGIEEGAILNPPPDDEPVGPAEEGVE